MGDLAFGKDFAMLSSGKEHFAVQLLNEGMQPIANFRKQSLLIIGIYNDSYKHRYGFSEFSLRSWVWLLAITNSLSTANNRCRNV
jgi:hypothetical protein